MEPIELRSLDAMVGGRVALLVTIDEVGMVDYYANTERLTIHSAIAMLSLASFRMNGQAFEGAANAQQMKAEKARQSGLILPEKHGDGIVERLG